MNLRRLPLACVLGLVTACSAGGGSPLDGAVDPPDAGAFDAGPGDDAGPGVDAGPRDGGCSPSGPDLCDGMDNDCDGSTLDGSGEPTIGMPCDGMDTDLCEEGVVVCTAGALACDDTTTDSTETCNGIDDDCDGMIDVGAGCPCTLLLRGSEPYLFCDMDRRWDQAQSFCAMLGYNTATIEDLVESDWVATNALAILDRDWWIGLNDVMGGSAQWASGSAAPYRHWGAAEPRVFGLPGAARIDDGTSGDRGFWSWRDTRLNRPFVCSLP